ncbi:MAG: ferrous iron transport protein A, partial [Massilibacteroides sp.]|nr:ferrous iron transport protein A [Massilibacteroides sp.]
MKLTKLSELKTGEKAVIVNVRGRGAFRKRIIEMGFIRGKVVTVLQNAPLKDPILYRIMGYEVSLRRNDAQLIKVLGPVETNNEIVQATNQEEKGPEATVSDTTREYMKE